MGKSDKPVNGIGLNASMLHRAFPFHIAFDSTLSILQLGKSLQQLNACDCPSSLNESFELVRPRCKFEFETLRTVVRNAILILRSCKTGLNLRGELLLVDDPDMMIFSNSIIYKTVGGVNLNKPHILFVTLPEHEGPKF